jgi:hypothetical protein
MADIEADLASDGCCTGTVRNGFISPVCSENLIRID